MPYRDWADNPRIFGRIINQERIIPAKTLQVPMPAILITPSLTIFFSSARR
jgi:hypothetical protein